MPQFAKPTFTLGSTYCPTHGNTSTPPPGIWSPRENRVLLTIDFKNTFVCPPSFWASMALDNKIMPAHVPQTTLGLSLEATHSFNTSSKLPDWRKRLMVVLSPPGKISPCKPASCSGSLISLTSTSTSLLNGEFFKALNRAALCSKKAPWMAKTPIRSCWRVSAMSDYRSQREKDCCNIRMIITGGEGRVSLNTALYTIISFWKLFKGF